MKQLVAATVRTSFGVKGELKLESISGEYEHLLKLESVVLRLPEGKAAGLASTARRKAAVVPEQARHTSSGYEFGVEHARRHGSSVVMKLAGIETPEEARSWSGAELLVPRADAAQRADGEYYYADLVGCAVRSDGTPIGRVRSIWNNGSNDMLEVKTDDGIRVIPFRSEFVGAVDIEEGTIELIAPWVLE